MPVYRRGSRSQNTPPSGNGSSRGRGGRSGPRGVLPAWYPRTTLGDITHVVRAIERRTERMGDGADQDTPPSGNSSSRGRGGGSGPRGVLPRMPLGDITHVVRAIERRRERMGEGADHDTSPSDAQLEHDVSFVTPKPKVGSKMFKQSVL
ncbi:hypothetical protein Hdeb2414_s0006g00216281 [Helianthus debilis subsp. tardiflorus]